MFLDKNFKFFLILVFVFYIFIRLFHVPQSLGFGSDAGRDYLKILNIYEQKDFTLIGPPSRFTNDSHSFYFGPAPYYIMLPALVVGNWSVLFASYYLIVLNSLAFITSMLILATCVKKVDRFLIKTWAILLLFFPLLIETSRTYWNPYFMPLVSALVVSILIKIKHSSLKPWLAIILGFLFGLGLQFHFSYALAIALCMSLLFFFRKLTIKGFLFILFGFCLGSLPLILFDLRNGFYNITVFLSSIKNLGSNSKSIQFGNYYLISLIPFVIYFAAYFIARIKKSYAYAAYTFLVFYIISALVYVIPSPKKGFDMVDNWNYPNLAKASKIVISENPQNYNIVDQLTGDNRAMAMRYLLASQGSKPMGVTNYPESDYLYVITNEPLQKILENPVWEISSGDNINELKRWKINKSVTLYKLGKKTT